MHQIPTKVVTVAKPLDEWESHPWEFAHPVAEKQNLGGIPAGLTQPIAGRGTRNIGANEAIAGD